MLDQDTARALVTIADEQGARLALMGDRQQLPAVGRGGVLELAHRWADPAACVTLDAIHRFTHEIPAGDGVTVTRVPDEQYAVLTLAMRSGEDPAAVFDALLLGGHIQIHPSRQERHDAIAQAAVTDRLTGRPVAVVVDTREQQAALNAVIRARLVTAGLVNDQHTVSTHSGQCIGRGDTVATRRNDPGLGVANRDVWTVTHVHPDGALTMARDAGQRVLPAGYVREHVELAYATTAYGAQGDTTTSAHLLVGEHTSAASAYVGMTRGRHANTAHLVADDLEDARELWVAAFARDRADLGPAHARDAAALAATGYTPTPSARHDSDAVRLDRVLEQLSHAWTEQRRAHDQLQRLDQRLQQAQADAAHYRQAEAILAPLRDQMHTRRAAANRAEQNAAGRADALAARAAQIEAVLRRAWDTDLPAADHAAATIHAGAGRLGVHRGRVREAHQLLDAWAQKWEPVFGDLRTERIADRPAAYPAHQDRIRHAVEDYARTRAREELPDHAAQLRAAAEARASAEAATETYYAAGLKILNHTGHTGDSGAAALVTDLTDRVATARQRITDADQHVQQLTAHPAITAHPDRTAILATAHTATRDREQAEQAARSLAARAKESAVRERMRSHEQHHGYAHDTGRHGPSVGR